MDRGKTCQVCHTQNPEQATQCSQCGAPLILSETLRVTDFLIDQPIDTSVFDNLDLPDHSIGLYLPGQTKPMIVELRREMIIGRHGRSEAPQDIDLTPYHAGLLGVSREHASLTPHEGRCLLTDLKSSNGTWVNERRLAPYVPHTLQKGDRIRLGQLILIVYVPESR